MMTDIAWRPAIGDPTWIGWITVAAYLMAAWFCARAGWRARQPAGGQQNESPLPWFVFAAGLCLLGVNKQLDLQTAFIQMGRLLARGEGWYPQRRLAQIIFVLALGAALAGMLFIVICRRRHFFKNHALTLLGSIFLAAFVFLRAAIFNHVDAEAGLGLGEGQWMDSLELAGVFCFIAASLRAAKIPPQKKQPGP